MNCLHSECWRRQLPSMYRLESLIWGVILFPRICVDVYLCLGVLVLWECQQYLSIWVISGKIQLFVLRISWLFHDGKRDYSCPHGSLFTCGKPHHCRIWYVLTSNSPHTCYLIQVIFYCFTSILGQMARDQSS